MHIYLNTKCFDFLSSKSAEIFDSSEVRELQKKAQWKLLPHHLLQKKCTSPLRNEDRGKINLSISAQGIFFLCDQFISRYKCAVQVF